MPIHNSPNDVRAKSEIFDRVLNELFELYGEPIALVYLVETSDGIEIHQCYRLSI